MAVLQRSGAGAPGVTYKVASSDTAAGLASAKLIDSIGRPASRMYVTLETNDIRWTIGVVPTQAGLGHLVADPGIIEVIGVAQIRAFRFISAAAGQHGSLQITLEYEQ